MSEVSQITVFDGYEEQTVEVLFQEEAELDVTVPLFYVNTGRRELERYVAEEGLPELRATTAAGKDEINSYVSDVQKPALAGYTQEQKDNIAGYVDSVSKPSIDSYITANVEPFSEAAVGSAAAAEAAKQAAQAAETSAQTQASAASSSALEAKQFRDEAEEIVYPGEATETNLGLAKIATAEEVAAGTDDSKFITPQKAAGHYQSKEAALESYQDLSDEITASLITISYQG